MQLRIDECKKCNKTKPIVNKKYGLCQECNWERLHPKEGSFQEHRTKQQKSLVQSSLKKGSILKRTPLKKKPYRIKQVSDKQRKVIKRDEEIYEEVWNMKDHVCEECECDLGDRFRDDNGKIIDRFRYSHILGKDLYPEHRHNTHNFNLLCLECHQKWEYGDKKSMKIYEPNQVIIRELKNVC